MVRGKVEIKRIENAANKQVTFTKRQNGILKKAYELSVLCDAQVALLIFSHKGTLYEFSSTSNLEDTIERYYGSNEEQSNSQVNEKHLQELKDENVELAKKIEFIELSQRKFLGQNLGTSTLANELRDIEYQLQRTLKHIKRRKAQLISREIERLKGQVITQSLDDVETELFIGLPVCKDNMRLDRTAPQHLFM